MGDDKEEEKATIGLQFAIGVFIVFSIFSYLYPGSAFYGTLVVLVSFAAVFMIVKGIWDYFLHGSLTNFWSGSAVSLVLVLFFDGLPVILSAFRALIVVINILFGAIAAF